MRLLNKFRNNLLRLLIICSVFLTVGNLFAAGPRGTVRKGVDFYNSEEYDKALAEFLAGMQDAPDRDELSYDVGTAFYKLQKYPEAMSAFSKSIEGQNPAIASEAWYNLGNSLVNDGNLEDALGAYKNSLILNHGDIDAKFNLETVRRLVQMQQQQQQESGESDSTQQNKDQEQQAEKQQGEDEKQKSEPNEDEKEDEQQAQNDQDSEGEPQDSTGQPQPEELGDMTEEEAQQLLQAMQGDELEAIKEKLRRQFGEPKRVEKDW
jgi:Ca-activated chloride channel family protein